MKGKMYGSVDQKNYYPLQIPGDYHPNMDHLELLEAQLTKEGMLAYESIHETSIAAFQEMILYERRAYFEALTERYSPQQLALEPIVISFCYPLMHMIATGQLFAPYFYHPDADIEERRAESEYCLSCLESWIETIDRRKLPQNMEMDWDGEWLSRDLIKSWNKNYQIPEVPLQMVPSHHPMKYVIQQHAIRMILPAKGTLPLGSYVGSPGFGLIHLQPLVLQSFRMQVFRLIQLMRFIQYCSMPLRWHQTLTLSLVETE